MNSRFFIRPSSFLLPNLKHSVKDYYPAYKIEKEGSIFFVSIICLKKERYHSWKDPLRSPRGSFFLLEVYYYNSKSSKSNNLLYFSSSKQELNYVNYLCTVLKAN